MTDRSPAVLAAARQNCILLSQLYIHQSAEHGTNNSTFYRDLLYA